MLQQRRTFLQMASLGLGTLLTTKTFAKNKTKAVTKPICIATWREGLNANKAAWKVLGTGGRALDAVEQGVMVTEDSINCCVGLGANPDRDGIVTLDSCIMDENGNAGSVAAIERIKHPISVARKVMENTPHVMLVGQGAQQFAVSQGFPLEEQKLSDDAEKTYKNWLKKSEYKPVVNVEKGQTAFAPRYLENGQLNHDTIGMVAMDAAGNLSGSCTTSGMGFKMRGRVGDSPIVGAGLFVDNEVGAVTSSGLGEEVIKICGTHTVVELMRQGLSPTEACKKACERIVKRNKGNVKDIQVGFIAINKKGEHGGYAIQKGFEYAVCYGNEQTEMVTCKSLV